MRLLVVSLNYAPELTATGKFTGEMATWLSGRGHRVDAVAGVPHYPEWCVDSAYADKGLFTERLQGVTVMRVPHHVPAAKRVTALGRIRMECTFTLTSLWWWMLIMFRRPRYDAVIAICPPMQDALLPWLYGVLRRVPWVFHIQDFQVDAAVRLRMLRTGLAGRMLYAIENFLVKKASRVSTITAAMRDRAIEKGADPERCWLVPNWADIAAVAPGERDNRFRRELGVGLEPVLVMYAGGMGAKQGLEIVIRVAAALRDNPLIQFVVVGTGADRPRLESLAQELTLTNLRFLPVQPLERVSEMLAAGDVHLIVQRAEAADLVMPSKLTNILAAGRPCIATASDDTALCRVLRDHDCGLAVPPEDEGALEQAILQLTANVAARKRMGANARAYAEAYLDRDAILERFEQQLRELVVVRR